MHFLMSILALGMIIAQQPETKLDATVLPPPSESKAESKESQTQEPAQQQRPASQKKSQQLEIVEDEIVTDEVRPSVQANPGPRVAAFWIIVPNSR